MSYADPAIKLYPTTHYVEGTTHADEPPLTLQELRAVLEHLTDEQRADVALLTEIGFEAYCMTGGDNNVAVELLLSGGFAADPAIMTEFVKNRFPNALQQVRPGLLRTRRQPRQADLNSQLRHFQELLGRAVRGEPLNTDPRFVSSPRSPPVRLVLTASPKTSSPVSFREFIVLPLFVRDWPIPVQESAQQSLFLQTFPTLLFI